MDMFGRKYARIHQLGFIVEDMDQAIREYSNIYHIKRWYRALNEIQDQIYYRGKTIKDDGLDLVIGYTGNLEIELITSTAEENIYVNFLRENGPGLHHIAYFVSNLDDAVQDYMAIGFEVVQNGRMGNGTVVTDFAYLRQPHTRFGNIVELSETRMFDKIPVFRNRFLTWVGSYIGGAKQVKLPGL
jgi:catechol 2,3-dioxygenase-like lactoylglutathione lyase family enzyme